MKTLLAAVETSDPAAQLQPGSVAALGALQVALADMAVDLEAIVVDAAPGDEDWKRYLSGDRAVFARKLAAAIDDDAIDRITTLYREDPRFHEAADSYLSEFEGLLAKAREGDGGGLADLDDLCRRTPARSIWRSPMRSGVYKRRNRAA